MIQITYKETRDGFAVLNGGTNIHREDAGALIKEAWRLAYQLNDIEGFKVSQDLNKVTVSGEKAAWQRILGAYSRDFDGSGLVDSRAKKLLAFA